MNALPENALQFATALYIHNLFFNVNSLYSKCKGKVMKDNAIKIIRWIPAAVIFGISWYLSSQEHVENMPSFWNADKLVHLVCFGGLCFWVCFGCNTRMVPKKLLLVPLFIVSAYGIIDEIHQSFVPGRRSSVFDWCADTVGAVLGICIFLFVRKHLDKKFRG